MPPRYEPSSHRGTQVFIYFVWKMGYDCVETRVGAYSVQGTRLFFWLAALVDSVQRSDAGGPICRELILSLALNDFRYRGIRWLKRLCRTRICR